MCTRGWPASLNAMKPQPDFQKGPKCFLDCESYLFSAHELVVRSAGYFWWGTGHMAAPNTLSISITIFMKNVMDRSRINTKILSRLVDEHDIYIYIFTLKSLLLFRYMSYCISVNSSWIGWIYIRYKVFLVLIFYL